MNLNYFTSVNLSQTIVQPENKSGEVSKYLLSIYYVLEIILLSAFHTLF